MVNKFYARNPNGELNKEDFVEFYSSLRADNKKNLEKISHFIFKTFDTDKNGKTINYSKICFNLDFNTLIDVKRVYFYRRVPGMNLS